MARGVHHLSLVDSLPEFLSELSAILMPPMTLQEVTNAAVTAREHGVQRAEETDYTLDEIIFEYQILREVLFGYFDSKGNLDFPTAMLLHSFLDTGIRKATHSFMKKVDEGKKAAREEIYQFMMQSPSAMVILLGPEFRFFIANPAYERLVGRKVQGKTLLEAFTHDEAAKFVPLISEVYESGCPYIGKELEFIIPGSDGCLEEHYINIGYYPFRDGIGEIKGVIADVQDVTDQVLTRRAVEENRTALAAERFKLQAIVEQSPAAMALWKGPDLIFEMVNSEYQKIFGNRQLLGRPLLEACPELIGQKFHRQLLDVLETGAPCLGYEELARIARSEDGVLEDRYYNYTYVQITDTNGEPYGVFDHAIDVTERVTSRERLKAALAELNIAKEEAEKANSLKSSFLANMSHEIRTPLGAILGFTDIMRTSKNLPEEFFHPLDVISRNGHALTKIIDDILDLSKIEAGKLEIENTSFSLKDLAQDVNGMFMDHANSKGISLEFDWGGLPPFKVNSDPIRIRQVLINLIGNAVKFTEKGSVKIETEWTSVSEDSIQIVFRIIDSGIGMSTESAGLLFSPFMQGDNKNSRKYGGTGLGLALSKKLGNALGGDVIIETCEEQKGCTFKFFLQVQRSQAESMERGKDHEIQLRKNLAVQLAGLNILVIDDSPDNRDMITIVLEREGAKIVAAPDGESGIARALSSKFDVILLDIQMPGIDGYQTLIQLRNQGVDRPVLALTAHAMKEERERALEAGFNDHVAKPINVTRLIQAIRNQVKPTFS